MLALLLALVMVFALAACGEKAEMPKTETGEDVTITLWTYPIGGWGKDETVKELIAAFEAANPGIEVAVEYLDYTNGDDQVNTAIEGKAAPDIIMEGPERLVTNWGAKGYMVDLELFEHEGDFYGYRGEAEQSLLLCPGSFLVVFPDDAHRLKIAEGAAERVSKVIFKILLQEEIL